MASSAARRLDATLCPTVVDARVDNIVAHLEALGFPFEESAGCPWLPAVEDSFGVRLPEPYRSLVEFFRFPEFDVPNFESFSNLGDASGYDIVDGPFKDPALREWLIPRRYIQIGRPQFANYDPVCFDMSTKDASPRIVRFDHEDILLGRERVRSALVAESFLALVVRGGA